MRTYIFAGQCGSWVEIPDDAADASEIESWLWEAAIALRGDDWRIVRRAGMAKKGGRQWRIPPLSWISVSRIPDEPARRASLMVLGFEIVERNVEVVGCDAADDWYASPIDAPGDGEAILCGGWLYLREE